MLDETWETRLICILEICLAVYITSSLQRIQAAVRSDKGTDRKIANLYDRFFG